MAYPPSATKTWVDGEALTASDQNGEFSAVRTQLSPENINDYSSNAAEMQTTADPYPSSTESLATTLQGEIARLRYQIKTLAVACGKTQWYEDLLVSSTAAANTIPVADATKGILFGLSDGTNSIHTKIVNIGDWNMDATASVSIAHGLTLANIRSVSAMIRNDANDTYTPLSQDGAAPATPTDSTGFISAINATTVTLQRLADATAYDNANYDSTSYNRGWITITYVV